MPCRLIPAGANVVRMGDSILHRRAAAAEAAERFKRRSELWAEARAERERWRAEMVPPAIAAELLGISRNTLGRWVKAGRITAHKLGPERQSPTRFRRADIARLKAALSGEPGPQADEPEPPAGEPPAPAG
jgi:excisionase family DNA binding protein